MADAKLNIIVNGVDKASGVLGNIGKSLGNMLEIAGGFLMANVFNKVADGIVSVGKTIVSEAMAAQEVQAQTNAVLKSTGGIAGVTAEQVSGLAGALSEVTKFSDDTIQAGENMLLTFTNIGKNIFPDATQAMLDMSQALGQDLKSSAMQLGKALNNPVDGVTALTRVGVKFDDKTKKLIERLVKLGKVEEAQKIILNELQNEFGGSAQAAGETFGGKLEILKNKLLNVAEGIGTKLLPIGEKLLDNFIAPGLEQVGEFAGKISDFGVRLGTVIQSILAGGSINKNVLSYLFGPEAAAAIGKVLDYLSPLTGAFQNLFNAFVSSGPMVMTAMSGMWQFLVDTAAQVAPVLMAQISGTLNTIAQFWTDHGAQVMAIISTAWQLIITTIGGALILIGGAVQWAVTMISGLWDAACMLLSGNWQGAWTAIQNTSAAAQAILYQAFTDFMNLVLSLVGLDLQQFNQIWSDNFEMAKTILQTIFDNTITYLQGVISRFYDIGMQLITGLWEGMKNRVAAVEAWLTEVWQRIMAMAEDIFGIQSPSKVFAGIGKNIMLGMEKGIQGTAGKPQKAAAAAAAGVTQNFNLGIYTSQSPNIVQSGFAGMAALANV